MQIPTAQQWMEPGNSMEELGKGWRAPKEIGIPQEDPQNRLTRTLAGSHSLNCQPKSVHGLDLGQPAYM